MGMGGRVKRKTADKKAKKGMRLNPSLQDEKGFERRHILAGERLVCPRG